MQLFIKTNLILPIHSTAAMGFPYKLLNCLLYILISAGLVFPCYALDPEPRRWNHIPVGSNYIGAAYAYTEADISFDPVLLLENVDMHASTWGAAYVHGFELFDKSARIDIAQAYKKATWTGLLEGTAASTSRSGWSDTLVRFGMNLYGAPPLSGRKFADYRAKQKAETIVGVALVVSLPTGDYKNDKLLNLGQNRYVLLPQVGFVHNYQKWTAEVTGEVAFFTENEEFYNGNTLEQKPMYTLIAHLMRSFKPGQWLGVSIGYEYGGELTLNGVDKDDKKLNIGWALSYAHPVTRQAGIKLKYIGTRRKELTGFDSETLIFGGVFAW